MQVELTKAVVMEKPSPLLVRWEFVRQYYTLLNQAADMLHKFYGKNSSYVHGGLDSNGKPADAVYGQKEIHRKLMSQNFTNCRTKIRHVDTHATLNDGVVVQVMGLYQDEVFGGFVTEPQEESEEEAEEPEERQQTPEVVPDDSGTFYDHTVSNDLEGHLEERVAEPEPDPEPEPEQEPASVVQEEMSECIGRNYS
ncbi:hypothetical protein EI555_012057 [Monodon monoceros]|uniref:NTF2 domain-containing protein n=1 Tax=Monodon monoceros TaxID=40151 RepID=A0A4U1FIK4_MONMO|nr:hypothetical protein EI555_012057 [Monodon monoceros]